ncbi:hypothetical protein V6N11_024433 [Hibiscus sabdariffa]|uniref:CCHC-type domain-containing protein n=1 Tax=Hibiscus sabdariffa TaxID=183260 RepID=A0ABR2QM30_9ROSI
MESLLASCPDPRSQKKLRRRDDESPDPPPSSHMECDGPVAARKLISYKDIVLGPNDSSHGSKSVGFDDDDIDLLEDDIAVGSENGVPTIDFSERVQTLALQSMDLTLVVKVLGRRIGYNTLHNMIYGIWKPTHPLKLIDTENDFFLVKFSDREDYLKVLTEGPWTILGHYLTVEQWTIDFQPTQASPSRLMAWIRLPGLPLTLYKRSFIEAIGSQVGSVIKIDFQTENGCRGRFARMAVSLNLRQPLVSKLIINGRPQIVEYESLPMVCFHCGHYGHLKDICPKLQCSDEVPAAASEIPLSTPAPTHSVPDEAFGPWMLVERRKRNPRSISSVISAPKDPLPAVSVVNPIFDLPATEPEIMPETRVSIPTTIDPGIPIVPPPSVTAPSRHNSDKHVAQRKSTSMSKKVVSIPTMNKRLAVNGSRVAKQPSAILKNPVLTSRAPSHLHESSTSKSTPAPKSTSMVVLDPAKHHVVRLNPTDHPRIPVGAISGGQVQHGPEAMLE